MNTKTLKLIAELMEEKETAALEKCMKAMSELKASRKEHPDNQGTDEQKKKVCKVFEELRAVQKARKDYMEEQWHG